MTRNPSKHLTWLGLSVICILPNSYGYPINVTSLQSRCSNELAICCPWKPVAQFFDVWRSGAPQFPCTKEAIPLIYDSDWFSTWLKKHSTSSTSHSIFILILDKVQLRCLLQRSLVVSCKATERCFSISFIHSTASLLDTFEDSVEKSIKEGINNVGLWDFHQTSWNTWWSMAWGNHATLRFFSAPSTDEHPDPSSHAALHPSPKDSEKPRSEPKQRRSQPEKAFQGILSKKNQIQTYMQSHNDYWDTIHIHHAVTVTIMT